MKKPKSSAVPVEIHIYMKSDLAETIKKSAAANERSVSAEVVYVLKRAYQP